MKANTYIDYTVKEKTIKVWTGNVVQWGADWYKNIINNLIALYIYQYEKVNPEQVDGYLKFLCIGKVSHKVLSTYYERLPPIESLEESDRRYAWESAKELFPESDNEFKMKANKILDAFSIAVS